MSEVISIMGAGICGLATALVLQQNKIDVKLFERAAKIEAVGAGIMMAINATQIFNELGIYEEIKLKGHTVSKIKIVDAQLKTISETDLTTLKTNTVSRI